MRLIEAENFDNIGGWSVDSQFIDRMGSSFLLAHGLGEPVRDAVTTIRLQGAYRLWVRTRAWAGEAGRFQVVINGAASRGFGIAQSSWGWEDGGIWQLNGESEIRLHDLTGFDGRCDALLFAEAEKEYTPPNDAPWSWRKELLDLPKVPPQEDFEFVVVGGGYAGMCAAVAAARRGVKTALVQDREVFGGNASSEVRVGPIGGLGLGKFPGLSNLAYELISVTRGEGRTSGGLRPKPDDAKIEAWLKAEKSLTLFKGWRCVAARQTDGEISGITIRQIRTSEERELQAKFFVDCTGDATLAQQAGATVWRKPKQGDETKGGYGSTCFWTTRWTSEPRSFPACPWALPINESNWQVNRPKFFVEGDYPYAAGWNWESGFDKDAVKDGEWIRDYNLRAAYGMWDYLKNRAPDKERYACAEMDWLGYVLGKRAAGRIAGDYVLTEEDLVEHREYEDGVVMTTWFLDLHFPHPQNAKYFPEGAFRSMAYDDPMYEELGAPGTGKQIKIAPYAIPYRCFYSRDIKNLFMAGKDISATHVAMSSVRVENTTAQMGSLVGEAVSLCLLRGWGPRELGARHLDVLIDRLSHLRVTSLAKRGRRIQQQRDTLKGEIKFWLRPIVRQIRKVLK